MSDKEIKSKKSSEQPDSELEIKRLVRRYKNGDRAVFKQIVEMYYNQVIAAAYKMLADYDEAADVAQTVFVKLSNNIWRYDEKKKFYTWLYRITVNASIDYIRKNKKHKHEPLENINQHIEGHSASPESEYNQKQLKKYIDKATEKLNDKQRSAFYLRDVEGCRINEVARMMDMPEATVRWYLHRARYKIKRELKRTCPKLLLLFGMK